MKHVNIAGEIKKIPGDFIVTEVNLFSESASKKDIFYYYILRKCNYTTFEAINFLAEKFNIPSKEITYSGLKDEDGVTEQYIALPYQVPIRTLETFNRDSSVSENKYIKLIFYKAHHQPLTVGVLCGNCFKVIIRKLSKALAHSIHNERKISANFINFYGPQRFGLPNQVKNTPLIGSSFLKKDYRNAIRLLSMQKNDIGRQAKMYADEPENFFTSLDNRQIAFFCSSHYSYAWNLKLIDNLCSSYHDHHIQQYSQDTVEYFMPSNCDWNPNKLINGNNFMEYKAVRVANNELFTKTLKRQKVVQWNAVCDNKFEDNLNPGSWAIELSFFLPSGCYATVALAQFVASYCTNTVILEDKILI